MTQASLGFVRSAGHSLSGYWSASWAGECSGQQYANVDSQLDHLRKEVGLELKALKQALDAHSEKDDVRHEFENKAIRLAEVDIERRLNEMNQFRAQISDERRTFVTWGALAGVLASLVAVATLVLLYFKK